jgi:predicted short-subunit dehydrogenase-like oxidoreductase (DUF2520 family)
MLPAMTSKAAAGKPTVAIVGPGRLGTALALALKRGGYKVSEIVFRNGSTSRRAARQLAGNLRAQTSSSSEARLDADLIWFCVADRDIATVASVLAPKTQWKGRTAFHSSGALTSDELDVLRQRGATVASVHPLMTFVRGSIPALKNVPFAVEGDAAAARLARRIARDLGGEAFPIRKRDKVIYHAWGAFASPLLIALLVSAEQVGRAAGLSVVQARKRMLPIVRQSIANYSALGPAKAFSGPLVRGDVEIVRQHLKALRSVPMAEDVYLALANAAIKLLPVQNRRRLTQTLRLASG